MRDSLLLFHLPLPEPPRWFRSDQHLRRVIRALLVPLRGHGPAGLGKVTLNLNLGLKKLGVSYRLENTLREDPLTDVFGILHGPVDKCRQLAQLGPCIVGPGVLNSAAEWPDLFTNSCAIYCVQNCEWAAEMYRPWYGDRVKVWKMGIDHEKYPPDPTIEKRFDFLIYDKIRWPETPAYRGLLEFCLGSLQKAGLTFQYLRYGRYPRGRERAYHDMLRCSRAMLFLSENETQGFAYNEALSHDVPILAWNFGRWCDPYRFTVGLDDVPATSIPYWDDRCGVHFQGIEDFDTQLDVFRERLHRDDFAPREYVLDNLRLEQGARRYLDIIRDAESFAKNC
jgi:hypothetical protein